MSILEGSLAAEVADALQSAAIPFGLTLTRAVVPGSPAYDPGEPVTTAYPCMGFVDEWSADFLTGGLVQSGDVKVVIVANTVAIEPRPGDYVTARGKTYAVVAVSTDPALATYTVQGRP